jgi:hypothetical protein
LLRQIAGDCIDVDSNQGRPQLLDRLGCACL